MSNLILFFDTETTGLPNKKPPTDKGQAHILQLGAILASPSGDILNSLNTLVQIGDVPIHPMAQAAHGISAERANAEGIPPKEAFEKFHEMCESAECLVCHNHNFDFKLIELTAAQIAHLYDDPDDVDFNWFFDDETIKCPKCGRVYKINDGMAKMIKNA